MRNQRANRQPKWANGLVERILVPLDGSRLAECALPHAIAIARVFGSQLILLRVQESVADNHHPRVDSLAWRLGKADVEEYLRNTAERIAELGVPVSTCAEQGKPAETVIEAARKHRADLIALSSHGRGGKAPFCLGSTAQKVVDGAATSVLLVRAHREPLREDWNTSPHRRILVAVDGSARAEWALSLAAGMAERARAELVLAQVVPVPELVLRHPPSPEEEGLRETLVEANRRAACENLEALRGRCANENRPVRTRLEVSENAAQTIEDLCDEEQIDLLVINAHGRGCGPASRLHGRLADQLLHYGRHNTLLFQDLPAHSVESFEASHAAVRRGA